MRPYLIARGALLVAGNLATFAVLAVILLTINGMHGQPLDALPALFMWYLILGGCRWLGRALPLPAASSLVPREAPLPSSAIAVSIAPAAAGVACPDFDTMAARLPANVARLIR